jgi:hypothetical protein
MKLLDGAICGLMALGLFASPAQDVRATPITGGPTGLTSPTSVISFDELGNLQDQTITNQFAAFGATFSGFGWDNATNGQAGSTGFAGGDLVNGLSPFPTGPMVISFTSLLQAAAFAAVDQGGTFTLEAFLGGVGGTLVESSNVVIPFNPGVGFIGFQGTSFDTIEISTAGPSALTIDTLQMQTIPEPATLALLGIAFAGFGFSRRRKPH